MIKRIFLFAAVYTFLISLLLTSCDGIKKEILNVYSSEKVLTLLKDNIKKDIINVYSGEGFSMLIKNGNLYTWGDNYYGQLGNGKTTKYNDDNEITENNDVLYPAKILSDIKSASAGYYHAMVITKNGDLLLWGGNDYGQLGDGTTEKRLAPFKLMEDVKYAQAGRLASIAITNDGSLWAWGYYRDDLYLDESMIYLNSSVPVKIADNVIKATIGEGHILFVDRDNRLYGIGEYGYMAKGTSERMVYKEPEFILDGVKDIVSGGQQIYATLENGNLVGWGPNSRNKLLGVSGDEFWYFSPQLIMTDAKRALAKRLFIKKDDSLWVTGIVANIVDFRGSNGKDNGGCVLDDLIFYDGLTKVLDNVIAASGGSHYLAVDKDLNLYSWGSNIYGQLGNGKRTVIGRTPYEVEGEYGGVYIEYDYFVETDNQVKAPEKVLNLRELE